MYERKAILNFNNIIQTYIHVFTFVLKFSYSAFQQGVTSYHLTDKFGRNFMLSASDSNAQFSKYKLNLMPKRICEFGHQIVRKDLFLKPSMNAKYPRLTERNF